ncbi:hypothetical protein F383_00834 [Gossypium arboreum]|uniref:Secreted protein n=1 Tax=Gossypium arboreum TaxID=29729 RepID=A0A0B0P991_GOSAR|nr:hypothetical protein F383_00834 [Gossypium arboreum]
MKFLFLYLYWSFSYVSLGSCLPYGPEYRAENATLTRGKLFKYPGHSQSKWSIVSARSPHQGQLELLANFLYCIFTFIGR